MALLIQGGYTKFYYTANTLHNIILAAICYTVLENTRCRKLINYADIYMLK